MINIESVTTMLADRVAKKDSYRPSGNIREQQLVDQLYEILDNVRTSSSYEMKNENTLDYDASFDDAHEDENYEAEADEEKKSCLIISNTKTNIIIGLSMVDYPT
jgi:hypothetical protein